MNFLSSRQTLDNIQELSERLHFLFNEASEVELDASKVELIDSASLQLIVAFVLGMKHCGIRVKIRRESESFKQAATALGVRQHFHAR